MTSPRPAASDSALTAPLDLASPWGGRSRTTDLGGPVHWVDFGGPESPGAEDLPPVVLVHGLGGSHLNWVQTGPQLARSRRVVALDLVGFGLTPADGRSTSVQANADLLARFVEEVVGSPAVLVGNSMGGMISLLLAADRPDLVVGLALVDPSLPSTGHRPDRSVTVAFAAYSIPFVGERFITRTNRRFTERERVQRTTDLCFADPTRSDDAVFDANVTLTAYRSTLPGLESAYLGAARSLLGVLRASRRYAAQIRSIDAPVLLVHGEQDRLVPVGSARRAAEANPAWTSVFLPGVGHTPQLEVPDVVLEHLEPWLDDVARGA
ncbi:MAG: alpha/beta hydrolase [Terracoccus sp.]